MHNSAAKYRLPTYDVCIQTQQTPLWTMTIDKGQRTARRRRLAVAYRNVLLDSLAVGGGRK